MGKKCLFQKTRLAAPTNFMASFGDFIKKPNNLDENIYKFRIYIEKTVLSNFLVKKYDFINDKIIEIFEN